MGVHAAVDGSKVTCTSNETLMQGTSTDVGTYYSLQKRNNNHCLETLA